MHALPECVCGHTSLNTRLDELYLLLLSLSYLCFEWHCALQKKESWWCKSAGKHETSKTIIEEKNNDSCRMRANLASVILFLKVKREIVREHGSFAGTTQCLFQNNKTLARFFACDKIRWNVKLKASSSAFFIHLYSVLLRTIHSSKS